MKPYFQDNSEAIYCGDCRSMAEIAKETIQCVITSPPYWGLRKYEGSQELVWGGDSHCEHKWESYESSLLHENRQGLGSQDVAPKFGIHGKKAGQAGFCLLCGAWKGAFGLEPTPEMYVQHTIEILREIRRVLRKDGVCFYNLGDSYASLGRSERKESPGVGAKQAMSKVPRDVKWRAGGGHNFSWALPGNIKPKDLCLIPFHIAIAAQQDGWWIRSVIIWNKPNPMPESVTDRPTNSYEFILMLTKSKKYYWDADAVREPQTGGAHSRGTEDSNAAYQQARGSYKGFRSPITELATGRNLRDVWTFPTEPYSEWEGYDFDRADFIKDGIPYTISSSCPVHGDDDHKGKSISAFIDTSMVCICRLAEISHFAVFPEKLPELCIKAATSEKGCCPKCGKPWARVSNTVSVSTRAKQGSYYKTRDPERHIRQAETLGWRPTCHCERSDEAISCIVLDPFMGTGTTLWVAKKLGRRAIGYDIAEAYCQLAVERNRQMALNLA